MRIATTTDGGSHANDDQDIEEIKQPIVDVFHLICCVQEQVTHLED
jgi:hypothetical protein